MIRFEDKVNKLVIEHGIAADRLNKDLINLLTEIYLQGFHDCHYHHYLKKDYILSEVVTKVNKTKESYEV